MTADTVHIVCPHCDAVNRVPKARLGERAVCGRCRKRLFEGRPIALDENRFRLHVARNDIPVVVDFWAPWCAPCRAMAPMYERAAATLEPRVRLAKLDTTTAPAVAGEFGISGIPCLLIFHRGRVVARHVGALDTQGIVRWVEGALAGIGA